MKYKNITNDNNTVGGRQQTAQTKEAGRSTRFISSVVYVVAVGCNDRSNNTYSKTDQD